MVPPTYLAGWHNDEQVAKMQYSKLGNTDLIVSQVGIGGAVFGGIYKDKASTAEMKEALIAALKSGMNFIDTSPFYGEGRSEQVLGDILKDVPRSTYYIATKVGRYRADMAVAFDFSGKRIAAEFENSLQRLGVDYVDLLQVHDFEFCENPEFIATETLAAVDEIRNSGKAKYVGITAYPLDEFHKVLDVTKIKVDTVLSYCRNIFTDSALQDHIPYFEGKGLGIINASPTGMGLLTNSGPAAWHPAKDDLKEFCTKVSAYCRQKNVELGKLSVYHNLQCSGPSVTLLGFMDRQILNINLDLIHNGLSEEEKAVYTEIQEKFFKGVKENWEGRELQVKRAACKAAE